MDQTRTVDENTTYALDLTNQSAGWQQMADLPNGRNHVAAASLNGFFYVIGGQHGQEEGQAAQSEVDRYDPSTNTWTQVASLPALAGKSHITSATLVYEGRIIVVGGETGYDEPQNTSSTMTPPPTPGANWACSPPPEAPRLSASPMVKSLSPPVTPPTLQPPPG